MCQTCATLLPLQYLPETLVLRWVETQKNPNSKRGRLGFNDNFDDPMHELELLRCAAGEQSVDTLSNIARLFFSFKEQQSAWLNPDPLCHRHYRVETRDLLPPFHVTPEVARYVPAFSSVLKAELRRLSQPSNPLRK